MQVTDRPFPTEQLQSLKAALSKNALIFAYRGQDEVATAFWHHAEDVAKLLAAPSDPAMNIVPVKF